MALIKCPDCGKEFSDQAAACPNCGRPNAPPKPETAEPSFRVWGCLLIVILFIALMVGATTKERQSPARDAFRAAPVPAGPQLELESWTWTNEYGYVTAEGRVKNIADTTLRSVEAVVTFTTKDGTFITSDDALIEFNPILPGQTSPFKVMTVYNPAMARATVEFKQLMGGTLRWRAKETRKAPPSATGRRTRSARDSAAAQAERLRKMDSAIFTPIFAKP
jgi:hypothetical protein